MLAPVPAQEAHTLARRVRRRADADVVQFALPQPVNGEPAPADVAADFQERVELARSARLDAEHPATPAEEPPPATVAPKPKGGKGKK